MYLKTINPAQAEAVREPRFRNFDEQAFRPGVQP